ncbi:MAG: hypothetical protein LBU23_08345 [Planctomycetota bacterium]|nr:hypothetical protein [Planctomycetota bacterium]MDR1520134.1 hypothetical protein [Planctomycetota bacterium]
MSTTMSTKRFVGSKKVSVQKTESSSNGITTAVGILIGGFAGLAAGAALEINLLMAAGFVAFTCAGLYLNGMFWASMEDKGLFKPSNPRDFNKYP